MAISRPCYASREAVKRALDVHETARNNAQVDRAIESASDEIDGGADGANRGAGCLHRRFFPEDATRYFDWPADSAPWRLWLDQHDLISVTQLVAGGETIAPGDYFLRPDDGPPYRYVEINLAGQSAFNSGDTSQRAIAITGTWGFGAKTVLAGALAGAINDTATTINVTDSAAMGVGDLVIVGTERMLVTDRRMLDTGQDLQAPDLTALAGNTTVAVTDGTAYTVDEVILVDAERMLVVDIAGNNLVVKRAWDGTVLAAHSAGAGIYAPRTLVVERGALGTTAASHADGASVVRHVPPALVRDLAVADAVNQLLTETGGYARTAGSGDNEREVSGRALADIRERAYAAYGRKARARAV